MFTTTCLLCDCAIRRDIHWTMLVEKFPATICEQCEGTFEQIERQPVENVHSFYFYNESMRDYFHRYKFMHDVELAKVFQKQLYTHLKGQYVVPIPSHERTIQQRTFAHVEQLLQAARIPFDRVLIKTNEELQGKKTRLERLATKQPFELVKKPLQTSVVLFDDIVTTGATLKRASELFYSVGIKEVKFVTLISAKDSLIL